MTDQSAVYTDEDLDYAVEAGAISAEAVQSLRACLSELHSGLPGSADHLRLVTGPADLLVAAACSLLLGTVATFGGSDIAWEGGASAAIVAWGLAEVFSRRQRMAAASILLALVFIGGAFVTCMGLVDDRSLRLGFAGGAAACAAALHWARFRVPVALAAGLVALLGGIASSIWLATHETRDWMVAGIMLTGLAIGAWAVWWDTTDRLHLTRRSDVAFWLYLLSAPLLMTALAWQLGLYGNAPRAVMLAPLFALYLALCLAALVTDRRVLLLGAMGSLLALGVLTSRGSGIESIGIALGAVATASALLLRRLWWKRARASLVAWLPAEFQASLPPKR